MSRDAGPVFPLFQWLQFINVLRRGNDKKPGIGGSCFSALPSCPVIRGERCFLDRFASCRNPIGETGTCGTSYERCLMQTLIGVVRDDNGKSSLIRFTWNPIGISDGNDHGRSTLICFTWSLIRDLQW